MVQLLAPIKANKSHRKIPPADWTIIWDRYKRGENSTEIAVSYGAKPSTICTGLVRRGYKLRTQRESLLRGRTPLSKSQQDARHYRKYRNRILFRRKQYCRVNRDRILAWARSYVAPPPPVDVISRICLACNRERNFSTFGKKKIGKYGFRSNCKECEADISRRRRHQSPEKRKEIARRWIELNREKRRAIVRRAQAKSLLNPVNRLKAVLRKQLVEILNNKGIRKTESALFLVGCTLEELKDHIEHRFSPGMNWTNYGLYTRKNPLRWNIDHIIPIAAFDLNDLVERRRCFHFTNLRPLWGRDNILKSNKQLNDACWIHPSL